MKDTERWLLVCDIDGTLYFPQKRNPGLGRFNRFIKKNKKRIVLALNSGRNLSEIALVAKKGPVFGSDWFISSVGTSIYGSFSPESKDMEWEKKSTRAWPREEIKECLKKCVDLEEQALESQHKGKLAYFGKKSLESLMPEIYDCVKPWKDKIKIIKSFDYYLDIVPLWGGKGGAVKHLAERLGIPLSHVLVAGDSGNDLDMLDNEFKSIIVSNYSKDLEDFVQKGSAFVAKKPAALGVLEGLKHYGVK